MNYEIYGFAFGKHNVSVKALYSVEQFTHCYLIFPNNIHKYMQIIEHDKPNLIIGMGMTRKSKYIKLEKLCFNNFRNKKINQDMQINAKIDIITTPKLKNLPNGFIFSETIGRYYCNLMSFKIQTLINKLQLPTDFIFIHVPKNADLKTLKNGISTLIKQDYDG